MKVEVTEIPDAIIGNSSGSRLLLADQIIEEFTPLFSGEIDRKRKQLNENLADVKKLKADILKTKDQLKILNTEYKKESLKNEILKEIQYLNQYDVLYGQNKQVAKDILSSIETQPSEVLSKSLGALKRLVRSHINKVIQ